MGYCSLRSCLRRGISALWRLGIVWRIGRTSWSAFILALLRIIVAFAHDDQEAPEPFPMLGLKRLIDYPVAGTVAAL